MVISSSPKRCASHDAPACGVRDPRGRKRTERVERAAAEHEGCPKDNQAVDQRLLQKRRGQRRPALDEERPNAVLPRARRARRASVAACSERDADVLERRGMRRIRRPAHDDDGQLACGLRASRDAEREPCRGVEHDARRRDARRRRVAHGELRVVGEHRADAHGHRVGARAQPVDLAARELAR